jgi:hypothetical protein
MMRAWAATEAAADSETREGETVRRPWILVVLVAVAALLGGGAAAAQDATPIVPAPNQCTVTPREITFFEQFVGTPTAGQATPADQATPAGAATPEAALAQLREGEPADRATRVGVLDTVRQVAACLNAGNFLAFSALFTDDYWRREAATEGPLAEEDLASFAATPEPLPAGGQAAILAVLDVRVLPGGRAAVLVDYFDPFEEPPGPARFLFILVEQDGRWLIDEEVQFGPIDPAQVGTPAA